MATAAKRPPLPRSRTRQDESLSQDISKRTQFRASDRSVGAKRSRQVKAAPSKADVPSAVGYRDMVKQLLQQKEAEKRQQSFATTAPAQFAGASASTVGAPTLSSLAGERNSGTSTRRSSMDMTQSRRASQRRTSATGSVGGWNASTKLADSAFMPSRGASKTASPNGDVSSHGWNMYEKRGLEEIHVLVPDSSRDLRDAYGDPVHFRRDAMSTGSATASPSPRDNIYVVGSKRASDFSFPRDSMGGATRNVPRTGLNRKDSHGPIEVTGLSGQGTLIEKLQRRQQVGRADSIDSNENDDREEVWEELAASIGKRQAWRRQALSDREDLAELVEQMQRLTEEQTSKIRSLEEDLKEQRQLYSRSWIEWMAQLTNKEATDVAQRLTGGPSPSLSPSAPLSDLERVLAQARSRARDRTPDPPARSPGRPPSPSASQSRGSLGRVSSFRSPPGARLQPQRAQSVRLRASAKEEGEAPPSPQRGPLDRRAQEELVSMFLALESDVKGLRAALRRAADLLESSGAPPPDVQSIRAVIGAPAGGAEDPEVTRLRSQLASAQAELAHVKRQRDALLLCEMQSDAPPATLERTDTVVTIAAGAAPAHGGEGGARSVTPGDSEAAGGDGGPGKGQAEAAGSITAVGKPTSPDRQTAGSLTPSPVGRMGSLAFPTVSGEEVRVMDNPLWGASNPGTPSVADGCDGAGVTSGRVAQGRVGGDGVLDVDVEELEVPELEASDADSDRFDPGEHEAFMGMLEKQMEAARERGKDLAAALRLVTRHDVRTLHPPEALEVQVRRMLEDRSIPLALTPPRKEGEGREGGEGEGEGEEDREGAPPSYADMARGAARVAVEGGVVSGLDGGALASDEGTGGKGEETLGGKDLDEVADVEEDSDEEVVPVPEVD